MALQPTSGLAQIFNTIFGIRRNDSADGVAARRQTESFQDVAFSPVEEDEDAAIGGRGRGGQPQLGLETYYSFREPAPDEPIRRGMLLDILV